VSYATQSDLIARFVVSELIQLTDPDALAINAATVANAIADAEAVIDLHLASRYTLPLASVPRVLVNIACDLARANLYEDRITEHVKNRLDAAMALLKQLSRGEISLGLDLVGQPTATTGGPAVTGTERVFNRSTLADY